MKYIIVRVSQDDGYVEEVNYIAKFDNIEKAADFIANKQKDWKESVNNADKYAANFLDSLNIKELKDYGYSLQTLLTRNSKEDSINYLDRILAKHKIDKNSADLLKNYDGPEYLVENGQDLYILEVPEEIG